MADGGTCTTAKHTAVYDVPKPVASSSRRRFVGNYDDVTRRKVAGAQDRRHSNPGREVKRKAAAVRANNARLMTTQAALLDMSATVQQVRSALSREAKAHRAERASHGGTKRKLTEVSSRLHTATALVMAEHTYSVDEEADKRRRVAIADVCGQGWSSLDGSYFRKKKAVAMAFVRDHAGDPDPRPCPNPHSNPNCR